MGKSSINLVMAALLFQESGQGQGGSIFRFLIPILVMLVLFFLVRPIVKKIPVGLPSIFAAIGLIVGLLISNLSRPIGPVGLGIAFIVGWVVDIFYDYSRLPLQSNVQAGNKSAQTSMIAGAILFIVGLIGILMRGEITVGIVGRGQVMKDVLFGGGSTSGALTIITVLSAIAMIVGLILFASGIVKGKASTNE